MIGMRKRKPLAAIEEARHLLDGLQFKPPRGAYARGTLVSVTVASGPGPEPKVLRISISCYMPGHLEVEWQGLSVFLEEDVDSNSWLTFLDNRGKATFHVAANPERTYRLASSLTGAELEQVADHLVLGSPSGEDEADYSTTESVSSDGLVRAKVAHHGDGLVVAEFRTTDATLARGLVHVEFVSAEGVTLLAAQISFREEEHAHWISRFEGRPQLHNGGRLRFAVRSTPSPG
jgi:hypothetical protein